MGQGERRQEADSPQAHPRHRHPAPRRAAQVADRGARLRAGWPRPVPRRQFRLAWPVPRRGQGRLASVLPVRLPQRVALGFWAPWFYQGRLDPSVHFGIGPHQYDPSGYDWCGRFVFMVYLSRIVNETVQYYGYGRLKSG